jgi:hypothetical protein
MQAAYQHLASTCIMQQKAQVEGRNSKDDMQLPILHNHGMW